MNSDNPTGEFKYPVFQNGTPVAAFALKAHRDAFIHVMRASFLNDRWQTLAELVETSKAKEA